MAQRTLEPRVPQINPEVRGIQFKRKLELSNFPKRPDFGTLGKRIQLISNCFSLSVPSGYLYHYEVTITEKPKKEPKESCSLLLDEEDKKYRYLKCKRNREVIKLMLETNLTFNNVYAVYDGQKNIYTRVPLSADFPIKCEIVINEGDNPDNPRQNVYTVETKPVYKEDGTCGISLDMLHAFYEKKISSVPQETIMALGTILRQGPCLQFTPIGRSFFESSKSLSGGLEIWHGYHQSIRLGQWGPMVNLNRTATAFYESGPVIKFIADNLNMNISELRRKSFLLNTDIKKLSTKLKNIKIEVTHLRNYRRKYHIIRLTKKNANQLEFELTENGRTVKKTVAAYFRERYGRNLEFPNLPCLQVQPEKKNTYIPIEVCEIIPGQHYKKKLDPAQTNAIMRFTTSPPKATFAEIQKIAQNLEINNDSHIQQFGGKMSEDPIKFEGRVLESPVVHYKEGSIKPVNGSWNMRQKKFFSAVVIKSWVLLSFAPNVREENLKPFNDLLLQIARELGMSIPPPKLLHQVTNTSRSNISHVLLEMKNKHCAELAVIVLPANDKFLYARIKQAAETIVGLMTQCVKENNVTDTKKMNSELVRNICLKINAKTGGENNVLIKNIPPILYKPVIIIGADVNHPGITASTNPSLAACVGSLDNRLSKYAVSVRAQMNIDERKKTVELIRDLKDMVLELLKTFYENTNGKKPEKIIFYRDGVSESQFDQVHDYEVRCIREACESLPGHYEPGITFIVVQKRHHIRFLPQDPREGAGPQGNVPAGTTVDSDVVDPRKFDFFLNSHLGLKGTSKPSHYTVLEDDNKFSADEIQKLTYHLCYVNSRSTKSTSIPVPVAYAHLAARRARHHLDAGLEDSFTNSDSSDLPDSLNYSSTYVMDAIKIRGELQKSMYFV